MEGVYWLPWIIAQELVKSNHWEAERTLRARKEFGGMTPFIGLMVKTESCPLYQASTLWTVKRAVTGEMLVTICSSSEDVRLRTSPNSTTGRLNARNEYFPMPKSFTNPLVFVVVPTFACKVWFYLQLVFITFRVHRTGPILSGPCFCILSSSSFLRSSQSATMFRFYIVQKEANKQSINLVQQFLTTPL